MKNRKTVLATVLALVLAFTSALSFSSCGESKKSLYRRHLPAGNA